MKDNTTNVQPIQSGQVIWESNPGFNPGTAFNPLAYIANVPVAEHIMVNKGEYIAIIAENKQLRTRIAELEEEAKQS